MCLHLFPLHHSSRAIQNNHPNPPANTTTYNPPPPCLAHLRALAGAGTSQHKDDLVLHGSGDAIGRLAQRYGPGEAPPKHLGNHQTQTPSPQSIRTLPMPCNHINTQKSAPPTAVSVTAAIVLPAERKNEAACQPPRGTCRESFERQASVIHSQQTHKE